LEIMHSKNRPIHINEQFLSDEAWYALYTKSRHEKRVEAQVRDMGIECYLPMRETVSQWSDRKKIVEKPLFPSYVFVRGGAKERYRAVQAYGAVMFITFNGQPARVLDEEIHSIRRVLKHDTAAEACRCYAQGDPVKIVRGPLAGLTGYIKETSGSSRLFINIQTIDQALSVNVAAEDVAPVTA